MGCRRSERRAAVKGIRMSGSAFSASAWAPFAAMLPVLWLFVGLGILKVPAHTACLLGLAGGMVLAFTGWGMAPDMLLKAALDGVLFAVVPILWVILAAFLTYNIALATRAVDQIRALLSSISEDRRIQALIIAWGFGSFLEAVAGFGTAVAVPAALLISLGFRPFPAALLCLLANTIAVAFGGVGIPVTTLAQITDLPVAELSRAILLQLTPFVLCVPALIVLAITGSLAGLLEVWLPTLAAGVAFGATQYVTALHVGPELPAVLGSIAAFAAVTITARLSPPKRPWTFAPDVPAGAPAAVSATAAVASAAPAGAPSASPAGAGGPSGRAVASRLTRKAAPLDMAAQLRAWSPYILLLLVVLGTSRLFPAVNSALAQIRSSWPVYDGPGGKPFTVLWLLTPGSMVMVSAVLGGLIQGAGVGDLIRLTGATARQLGRTTVTILCIVALAKVLSHSGMVASVAAALAAATGGAYALFAPVLGMLGTFITGSDTSSNILFGQLQREVAMKLGSDPVWLAAANTSGACIGKLISPQSIAIAGIAAGLRGREGDLLLAALRYALAFIAGLGLLVYWFA